eukprot:jgi/Undpi1/10901/HiC_scaffold_3.g01427.m1
MNCVGCDICVYHLGLCVFFPGVCLSSRVTGACPVTTDLIVRVNVRTTTTTTTTHQETENLTNWYADSYTGTYYLESNVHIRNGATLTIDGSENEVDECETLLLASNSTTYLNIRAHGGNLDIQHTKIFSWDLLAADYDTDPDDGRSYLSAVTEKITGRTEDTCPDDPRADEEGYSTGRAKNDMGDARMDIFKSEIAYLGYSAAESYGIAYKARGLCNDLTNLDIYDDDNGLNYGVTGDIKKSELHHNWFGHYSWGHDGGNWNNNEVHDNYGYGFDPHDDSDNVNIIGNTVYNNGWHGIIASKRCTDITIKRNTVYNNGENGIMLHRSCDRAYIQDNHSYGNNDAGIALYESSDCRVLTNTLENNKHGIRWSNGANRNRVYKNTIYVDDGENTGFAFYMYRGNDEPEAEGNEDGHPINNVVYKNDIYSEKDEVWKMEQSDYNNFWSNVFHSGAYARFEDSTYNKVHKNTYPTGWCYNTDSASCFKTVQDPVCGEPDNGLDTVCF